MHCRFAILAPGAPLRREDNLNPLTKLAACAAVFIGVAGFTSTAIAASTSATFNVTATIIESCTVASKPSSFRNYQEISGARLDELVLTSRSCPLVASHAITVDARSGIRASVSKLEPTGHAGPLLIDRVFSDAAGVSVSRDDNGGAVHKFSWDMRSIQPIPVQGSVPFEQNAMVGSYADTLTVLLAY